MEKKFIRPGLCSASGRKVRSPSTTVSRGMPIASAAEAAASVFSTLKRESPARVIGTSTSSTSGSGSRPGASTETQPSITVVARPPSLSVSRIAGESGSRPNTHGCALITPRIAKTRGSSALSTAQPLLRVIRGTTDFTSASWSTVSMPCRPRWSAETLVTTETSLRVSPIPLSRIPPRAVSVTANCTSGCAEHPAGAARPGVVARLHHPAVDVDAVGVGPADQQPRRARDVRDHPARSWSCRWCRSRRRPAPSGSGCAAQHPARSRPPPRPPGSPPPRSRRPSSARPPAPRRAPRRPLGPSPARAPGAPTGRPRRRGAGREVGRTRTASRDVPGLLRDRPHQPAERPQREPLPEPRLRRARAGHSAARSAARTSPPAPRRPRSAHRCRGSA